MERGESEITARLPVLLLADSQLLFWRDGERPFLASVRELLRAQAPSAAYIGASNGDQPEFFDLFRSAMESIGITDSRMILRTLPEDDAAYLERADLIVLAGGDERAGWDAFRSTGIDAIVARRYRAGALVVGISAGAVQLGLRGDVEGVDRRPRLGIVPYLIDVHREAHDWTHLKRAVAEQGVTGLGIPSGGGAFFHEDCAVQPIRRPVTECTIADHVLRVSAIFPP